MNFLFHICDAFNRTSMRLQDKYLGNKYAQKLGQTFWMKHERVFLGSSTIRRIPAHYMRPSDLNLGMDSICTHHMMRNMYPGHYDTLVLYIGANDLFLSDSNIKIASNIVNILNSYTSNQTPTQNLVYIPIIMSTYQLLTQKMERIRHINAFVSSRAPPSVKIVDLPVFASDDFVLDQLHLSETGYEKLMKTINQ